MNHHTLYHDSQKLWFFPIPASYVFHTLRSTVCVPGTGDEWESTCFCAKTNNINHVGRQLIYHHVGQLLHTEFKMHTSSSPNINFLVIHEESMQSGPIARTWKEKT